MGEGDANRTFVMGDNFGRGELPSVVCYICRAPELTTKLFKGQICHNQGCKDVPNSETKYPLRLDITVAASHDNTTQHE